MIHVWSKVAAIAALILVSAGVVACSWGGEAPAPASEQTPTSAAPSPTPVEPSAIKSTVDVTPAPLAPASEPTVGVTPASPTPMEPSAIKPTVGVTPVSPTPTSEPDPTVEPPADLEEMSVSELRVPGCHTSGPTSAHSFPGTIPPPPAPVPAESPEGAGTASREEIAEYLRAIVPVADALEHWWSVTRNQWSRASKEGHYAALVFVEATRNAALCRAISLVAPPPVARAVHSKLALTAQARQDWATEVHDALGCCGSPTPQLEERLEATLALLRDTRAGFDKLGSVFGIDLSTLSTRRHVESERLAISLDVPAEYIPARNDSQLVLLAPLEFQVAGLSGLAPDGSPYGASLQVQRLRMEGGLTAHGIGELLGGPEAAFGELRSQESVLVAQRESTELVFVDPATGWQTQLVVTNVGSHAYVFVARCPSRVGAGCSELGASAASRIAFLP